MSSDFSSRRLEAALQHHQAGRLADAEAGYRAVLAADANNVIALHHLGAIAFASRNYAAAAALMHRAAAFAPGDAVIRGNLGEALSQLGRRAEAIECFKASLALKPDDPLVLNNLGGALAATGEYDRALACYRRALALRPAYAIAHNNLGLLCRTLRRFDDAIASFRRAVEIQPDLADAWNNLGGILTLLARFDEAVACYERALARAPDSADVHNNLAVVFGRCGRSEQAVASHRRAVALAPNRADFHSNLILALLYHAGADSATLAAEFAEWNRRHAAPLRPKRVPHENSPDPARRIRIGYVSADFRDHVVGRNLLPLFRHHSRDEFEIFCYAHVPSPDALTAEIRARSDHWREVAALDHAQLADQIRRDAIGILVDLGLHTAKNRLLVFARKPAPVQVSFAGYPGGTGLETIDYHLTDRFLEPPEGSRPLSDAPFHFHESFWCYDPVGVDLPVTPLPALSARTMTFGCLNNFSKVTPAVVKLWARVLQATPGSRIMLLSAEGRHRADIAASFERVGVNSERLVFFHQRPRAEYLALYHQIDLGLDTFPYTGHTTSLDSLWMGVPVVTLVGPTPVSRAGWSQLSNLRLTEFAARTPDEFIQIAVGFARDLPRLGAVRARLRQTMERSPLMDGAGFSRAVASAYRTIWRHWCETH